MDAFQSFQPFQKFQVFSENQNVRWLSFRGLAEKSFR